MVLPGRRPLKKAKTIGHGPQQNLFAQRPFPSMPVLPAEDNTPEGLRALLTANAFYYYWVIK